MSFYAQYHQVRKQSLDLTDNDNVVAIIKLGDFFEAFDDDAKVIAEICNITMHRRRIGKHSNVPMTGFPVFSAEKYIAQLISAGYTVMAIEYARQYDHCKLGGIRS